MNDAHAKATHEPKDPTGNHFPEFRRDHESRIKAIEDALFGDNEGLDRINKFERRIRTLEKDILTLESKWRNCDLIFPQIAKQQAVSEAFLEWFEAPYEARETRYKNLLDAFREALK